MKIAIAGLGRMGQTILPVVKSAPQTSTIIGFDPSPEARAAATQKHGILATSAYQDILKDPAVRLVFITAPNQEHAPLALQALAASKAVMCEKPMATTLTDAQQMAAAPGFLQIGFELRYSRLYELVKERIDAGLLGKAVHTQCTYICSEFHGKGSWRNLPSAAGGMFGEKLSHYVDLPRWWINSPVQSVYSASSPNVVPYFQVRDNYQTTVRYADGSVSHLTFMMSLAQTHPKDPLQDLLSVQKDDGHELRFLILGTKGAIETNVFHRRLRRWEFGDSPTGITSKIVEELSWLAHEDHTYIHNTSAQALDVIARVSAGKAPRTSAADALQTMRVVFAAEESSTTGHQITLPA